MTILNDKQIEDLCDEQKMITPYAIKQVREVDGRRVISYGLSSFGYDARVADEFRSMKDFNAIQHSMAASVGFWRTGNADLMAPVTVDPKAFNEELLYEHAEADVDRTSDGAILLAPHSFTLARTVEYFRIPEDVMVICLGKSTYARCGLIVNVTPLEPSWEGHVTLELSNTTPLPIKVYPNEGIAQFVFFRGERPAVNYADRNEGKGGKYQKQEGITVAKL